MLYTAYNGINKPLDDNTSILHVLFKDRNEQISSHHYMIEHAKILYQFQFPVAISNVNFNMSLVT